MSYHLLTGATGLLGSYLLRDLLLAGHQVAAVVRPGIAVSAQQRIEDILARWERQLGHALPRPPVLEGDLTEPDLGLPSDSVQWLARHCVSVLHNAASLTFEEDPRSGEPWRSNVEGTRGLLEFCRKVGLKQFHHVSTAYVCGLREGRILETELDVGQAFGNPYERSKAEAERLVRGAGFLVTPTIYRPAIIIGDSHSGYTSTFHGFYTPLRIIRALADRLDASQIDGRPLMVALGLTGHETKNFVPVDWLSRVITYLYGQPRHHGRTYHLTPPRPTSVATTCEVMEQAVRAWVANSKREGSSPLGWKQIEATFLDQMEVYRAYWRNDPQFDRRNTLAAAGHLPCPEVDAAALMRTAQYALESNFGWPQPQPQHPPFDVPGHLRGMLPCLGATVRGDAGASRVGLQVNGPGGGQWTLDVEDGRILAFEQGLAADHDTLLYLNSKTFQRCAEAALSAEQALRIGQVVVEGNHLSRAQVQSVLEAITIGQPAA